MNRLKTIVLIIGLLLSLSNVRTQNIDTMYVYPNPTADQLNVHIKVSFGRYNLDLYDIVGRNLFSPINDSIIWPGKHEFNYDISFLKTGLYLLRLESNTGESMVVKVIKKTPVAVAELIQPKTFIYPNPARHIIHVPDGQKALRVFDTSGKQVLFISQPTSIVDISGLENGLYLVELVGKSTERTLLQIEK
ncbi:T9SS type A sorting domain-containing protein [bacterium SCSIO 12643]|nr:T9SS type A sorting domain-containing protein [bacterium SCSIO 12643]